MKRNLRKVLLFIMTTVCLFAFFKSTDIKVQAEEKSDFYRKEINITSPYTSYYSSYWASTPDVVSFFDYKGRYNVAGVDGKVLHIYRYNSKLKLLSELKIKNPMDLFGDIICDGKGNYYVCWGKNDYDFKNIKVITVTKYDYNGKKIASKSFKGYDLSPYSPGDYWGTRLPFDAGTCEMAINNGVLACNFAREMYSGHQSNMVFYLDCETLKRKKGPEPYCSHSFDQYCIPTSDGGFLMANQGDAYPRGFLIDKVNVENNDIDEIIPFHFREGADRPYGYNETFAQLGGLAETQSAYVLCASSDRTLSLNVKKKEESRDVFVQILKKDFYNYKNSDMYYAKGKKRIPTGKRPDKTSTELILSGNEKDYGVIWLTNYDGKYFATSPKVLTFNDDKILVMWERRSLSSGVLKNSYYMILNEDGTVYRKTTKIGACSLPANADVVLKNGKVYWVTGEYANEYKTYINTLDVRDDDEKEHSYKTEIVAATLKKNGKTIKKCTECGKITETVISQVKQVKLAEKSFSYDGKAKTPSVTVTDKKGKILRKNTDYTVSYAKGRKKVGTYKVTVKFKGKYKGTKTLTFKINPGKAIFENFCYSYGTSQDIVIYWNEAKGASGYILEYSTSSKFKKEHTKTLTIKSSKTIDAFIPNVDFSKNYYFRIRAYKTVNKKKYYSEYDYITVPAPSCYYYT